MIFIVVSNNMNNSNKLLKQFSAFFMYKISLILCNFLNNKPIWKHIHLPNLVWTEQFWYTFHTNSLLAEIWSKYKLWSLKYIFHVFFIRRFLTNKRAKFFCLYKNNCWYHDCTMISLFMKVNSVYWLIWIWHNTRRSIFNSF